MKVNAPQHLPAIAGILLRVQPCKLSLLVARCNTGATPLQGLPKVALLFLTSFPHLLLIFIVELHASSSTTYKFGKMDQHDMQSMGKHGNVTIQANLGSPEDGNQPGRNVSSAFPGRAAVVSQRTSIKVRATDYS